MAGSFLREKLKMMSLIFCVLALVFMLTSLFMLTWFTLDAEKNVGGVADVNLKADFYQYRVKFKATANVTAGGIASGLAGGIIDIGAVTGDGEITIEDEILYWEGLERFQGMIGVLFDTTKNADYSINLQTWNSTNTWVWVNTHTDIIPWWPEGIAQEITITVRLNQTDNVQNVRINKVWINVYKDWDYSSRRYQSLEEKAWEIEPGDFLYKEGDQKVYKHGVAIEKEWGDKIGIIAMVDLTMTDTENGTDIAQIRPFTQDSHPQKMINIRPIGQVQFISIIMIFVALPFSIIGIIFAAIAIIFTLFDLKRRTTFMLFGGIFEILGVLFFVNGINNLASLITFLTEDDYKWNTLGLAVPLIGGALLVVAYILQKLYRPKEEEVRFDISAAMGLKEEEEEEGEVQFECPECGTEFSEMVSTCPECGAEFEGIDEEEEEGEEEPEEGEGEEEEDEDEVGEGEEEETEDEERE